MLRRKTPIKRTGFKKKDPEKIKKQLDAWKARSKRLNPVSKVRKAENSTYSRERQVFLSLHRVCPVTGEPTSQIHHSAKRERGWLNLQRYWIAVSPEGHRWIEDNKTEAEKYGLMVRIREIYEDHINALGLSGISLTIPLFYEHWDRIPIKQRC